MSEVLKKVATLLFWLFAIVAFGLMVSLTYSAIMKIFPGDQIKAIWGVSMFDFACVIWLMTFAFKSEGMGQRAGALINFILALLGTLGMVALEVLIGGQDLLTVDTSMGEKIVYLFIGITVANLCGIYWHHLTEPSVTDEIEQRSEMDKVTEEARAQASQQVREMLPEMGRVIAARYVQDVYSRLRLADPGAGGQVIDAVSRDVVASEPVRAKAEKKAVPWAGLFAPKQAASAPQNDLSRAIPVRVPVAVTASGIEQDGRYRGFRLENNTLVYTTPESYGTADEALAAVEGGGKTENRSF